MSDKELANLLEFKVSINTDGNVVLDYTSPPDPDSLEKAFDEWNDEYEKEDTTTGSQELSCTAEVCEVVDIGT